MKKDSWVEEYVDNLMMHIIGLRMIGIRNHLPKFLWQAPGEYSAIDENGVYFGNLRESHTEKHDFDKYEKNPEKYLGAKYDRSVQTSVVREIKRYMDEMGADLEFIVKWINQQHLYSFDEIPVAVKMFYMKQRNTPMNDYYWGRIRLEDGKPGFEKMDAVESSLFVYDKYFSTQEDFSKNSRALVIWHAFMQEILAYTNFRFNDQQNSHIRLLRTVSKKVLEKWGIDQYGSDYQMMKAVYDSCSLYNFVKVLGSQATVQWVPHHRIIHSYFAHAILGSETNDYGDERDQRNLVDYQSEFLMLGEGIAFDYLANKDVDFIGDARFDEQAYTSYYFQAKEGVLDAEALETLFYFSITGNIEFTKMILDSGVHVEFKKDYFGDYPLLEELVKHATLKHIKLYISKISDLIDLHADSLLRYAAKYGKTDIIKYLIKKGIFSSNPNEVYYYLREAVYSGNLEVVELIYKEGGTHIDQYYHSALLSLAARYGKLDIFKFFLDLTGIDIKDIENKDFVLEAAREVRREVLEYILAHNVDLNYVDPSSGETALIILATRYVFPKHERYVNSYTHKDLEEIANMLIEKGADLDIKDHSGKTALDYVKEYGHWGIPM